MKKALLGIVVVVLLAVCGGAWWLFSHRDSLIADAIRTYGPEILGVSVKLGGVKTDVANQTAELHGLVIGNPPGFATAHALSLGAVSVKLDLASLTKDVILIKEVAVIKPDITYDYKSGGSNLDVIQRNAEKFVADKTGGKDSKNKSSSQKLIIEKFYVKDAKAEVSAELLKGKTVSVAVPDIHLTDIGKKSNGATAGEAVKQIISAVTASVTRASSSAITGSFDEVRKKGAGALKGLFK